jgi:hypothetical protein
MTFNTYVLISIVSGHGIGHVVNNCLKKREDNNSDDQTPNDKKSAVANDSDVDGGLWSLIVKSFRLTVITALCRP